MKIKTRFFVVGLLAAMGILTLRPVPNPTEQDCLSFKGTVTEIYEAGVKDVVFEFQGLDKRFYVNRGLERGLDLTKIKLDLTNKEIVIKYPKYWTPLDPGNSWRHISKIESEGRTIFTEVN